MKEVKEVEEVEEVEGVAEIEERKWIARGVAILGEDGLWSGEPGD